MDNFFPSPILLFFFVLSSFTKMFNFLVISDSDNKEQRTIFSSVRSRHTSPFEYGLAWLIKYNVIIYLFRTHNRVMYWYGSDSTVVAVVVLTNNHGWSFQFVVFYSFQWFLSIWSFVVNMLFAVATIAAVVCLYITFHRQFKCWYCGWFQVECRG